jgi:hypothetical protein
MSVLEISRDVGDKRRFILSSVGTATLGKFWNDAATLEVAGHPTWRVTNTKMFKPVFVAVDPEDFERARFDLGRLELTVGARSLRLERTAPGWITKAGDHRLVEEGRDLVGFAARKWGRRPVTVTVHDDQLLGQPMLLLFAAFAADRVSNSPVASPIPFG